MNTPPSMATCTIFMVMTGMDTIAIPTVLFIPGALLVMIAGLITAYMDAGTIDRIMGFQSA
jgi:hypothetical protein